ncbi:MAG: hypothetical protein ACPHO6_16055, partial [Candidatus Latescibacterota bacterium]
MMPSENSTPWTAVEPDIDTITQRYENPIGSLAQAECPAFVLRQAYNPDHCRGLVRRFIDMGLMRDRAEPRSADDGRPRIDIGTSLGNRGSDKERFLQHAQTTHFLFDFLFKGYDDPVQCLYEALTS